MRKSLGYIEGDVGDALDRARVAWAQEDRDKQAIALEEETRREAEIAMDKYIAALRVGEKIKARPRLALRAMG